MVNYLDLIASWGPPAGIILTLSTMLVALVYMFGNLLQNERIKAWAKIELFEVFYSALIFGVIIMMLPITMSFVEVLVTSGTPQGSILPQICNLNKIDSAYLTYNELPCHISVSVYFYNTIFREASGLAFQLFSTYLFTSALADFTINIEFLFEKAGFFTFNPWRGLLTMGNAIKSNNFDILSKLMIVIKFQEVLLVFVARAMFPVLLVLGLLLRSTVFTRRLGGLLIALALALYFVYPMFPVMGAVIVDNIRAHTEANRQGNPDAPMVVEDVAFGQQRPSIIHNMYVSGTIPTLEGAGNDYDFAEAQRVYAAQTGQSSEAVLNENIDITPELSPRIEECPVKCDPNDPVPNCVEANRYPADCEVSEDEARTINQKSNSWFKELMGRDWVQKGFIEGSTIPGGVIDATARVAFFSLFFSFLGILATIATVRSISGILGGDLEIAGLTHLI